MKDAEPADMWLQGEASVNQLERRRFLDCLRNRLVANAGHVCAAAGPNFKETFPLKLLQRVAERVSCNPERLCKLARCRQTIMSPIGSVRDRTPNLHGDV